MIESVTEPGVEMIIVADTYHNDVHDNLVAARTFYGDQVVWIDHDAGYHCWGHPQRNEGMRHATAPWLMFAQDDTVLLPDALWHIRAVICFRWKRGRLAWFGKSRISLNAT